MVEDEEMRKLRVWSLGVGVVLVLSMLAACAPAEVAEPVLDESGVIEEPAPTGEAAGPEPSVEPGVPLVRVYRHGGLCVYGTECSWEMVIHQDGSYTIADGGGTTWGGALDEQVIAALRAAVEDADYTALRAVPFTDTCPIAYDGQESIYTFYTGGGEQEISSCEVQIDETQPLFVALGDAVAQATAATSE